MSLAFKLILTLLLELVYAVATRAWLPSWFHGVRLELLISAGRALVAGIVWMLFRDSLLAQNGRAEHQQYPLVLAAATALFLEAILVGNAGLDGRPLRGTFAATSFVVGVHEELVYRGVLQNLLLARTNLPFSLLLSSLCFTLYHFGAQPLNPLNFLYIFLTSCTLGLIYERTRSLGIVIGIHAIVDALFSFSPFLHPPWPPLFGDYIVLVALLMALSLHPNRGTRPQSQVPQLVRIADDV